MPNPNMTYEELRTQLDRLIIENQDDNGNIHFLDQAAMRDEIIQLFATLGTEVTGTYAHHCRSVTSHEDRVFNDGVLATLNDINARIAQLTTKNTEAEGV